MDQVVTHLGSGSVTIVAGRDRELGLAIGSDTSSAFDGLRQSAGECDEEGVGEPGRLGFDGPGRSGRVSFRRVPCGETRPRARGCASISRWISYACAAHAQQRRGGPLDGCILLCRHDEGIQPEIELEEFQGRGAVSGFWLTWGRRSTTESVSAGGSPLWAAGPPAASYRTAADRNRRGCGTT